MSVAFDPLCRIFGNPYAPVSGIQGPNVPRTEAYPYYEVDASGFATPKHFDNDIAIQMYEETLKLLTDNTGVKHPGVCPITEGLARLYELKAGVEKNVAYYDKAIEHFKFANSARRATMGLVAESDPKYIEVENKIQKILRKKTRRLDKEKVAIQDDTIIAHTLASRVVEVYLLASGSLVFTFENGTQTSFMLPGAAPRIQANVLDEIDDDQNDSYSAAPFYLQSDEFLVGVISHEKQGQRELNAIAFHTSSGRRSHLFKFSNVEPLGREYFYWADKGSHIIGFQEIRGEISIPLRITEGFR